ncbi:ATP-binding protein, partial [Streptomyces sp. CRB46]
LYVVGTTLRIEVTDTRGEALPRPQTPAPDAEHGRGLLLVEALAHRWGVTEGRFPRKTVWAELRCAPPEPTI